MVCRRNQSSQLTVNSTDSGHLVLETFPNPESTRDYVIRMRIPEFTCLCPRTGQPDFAVLYLEYIPDKLCIELKSLKNYIWSFRDKGVFHEAVTNQILGSLAAAVSPNFMRLTADFNVRGGIYTSVVAEHRRTDWRPEAPVHLPDHGRGPVPM
jgi:7-cyano-7-deazaguanine reductase